MFRKKIDVLGANGNFEWSFCGNVRAKNKRWELCDGAQAERYI